MNNKSDYMPVECLQIPKVLFRDERYRNLSVDAKVLYALLLDRLSMAVLNGWVDECGDRFVIYPKSEMIADMHSTRYRVDLAISELYQNGKLVVVTQRNPGRPCQIYVKDITGQEEENKVMNKMNTGTGNAEKNLLLLDEKGYENLAEFIECITCKKPDCNERKERFFKMFDYLNHMVSEEPVQEKVMGEEEDETIGEEVRKAFQKKRMDELFARKLIDSDGNPNKKMIESRSSVVAAELKGKLIKFEKAGVIHTEPFFDHLVAAWNNDDYETIYLALYCVQLLMNFSINFYDDLFWIDSGKGDTLVEVIYMNYFIQVLCGKNDE